MTKEEAFAKLKKYLKDENISAVYTTEFDEFFEFYVGQENGFISNAPYYVSRDDGKIVDGDYSEFVVQSIVEGPK